MLGAHLRSNPTFPFPLLPKAQGLVSEAVPSARSHCGQQEMSQLWGLLTSLLREAASRPRTECYNLLIFSSLQLTKPRDASLRLCGTGKMLEAAPCKGTASALFSAQSPGAQLTPPQPACHSSCEPRAARGTAATLTAKPALKLGVCPSTRGQAKGSAIHSTGTQHLRAWPSLD